jgi:two-component system response regulator MprA
VVIDKLSRWQSGYMHVLVVDDEPAVRDSLARSLRFEGYEVSLATDGNQALKQIEENPPDVVVLDVLMPQLDGLATCRKLRARGNDVPVLMLTARDGIADRVVGLDAGADDYLVKPFALEELLARLRALLRRANADSDDTRLTFADLSLDPVTREVSRGDRPISLTVTEFNLLEMLLEHPRQVLTRAQIVQRVWGFALEYSSNSLEVYVGYLRRKLEAEGEGRLIHTVRGIGYVLRESPP